MSKPIIILLHGMGSHSAPQKDAAGKVIQRGSFGDEFVQAANAALHRYPNRESLAIENLVELHEIHYNDFFDEIRQEMAGQGNRIASFIAGVEGAGPLLVPGLITKIAGFESSLADDDFYYTHWLDVLFYKTYLGEKIRVKAAAEISRIISEAQEPGRVHIIAHSLGTAVAHDTLHKLYRQAYRDDDKIHDLSPVTHKIKSLWMFANVSRLANCVLPVCDPHDSVVRPGDAGMTQFMFNARHELDPFTWPRRFGPRNDGRWIAGSAFGRYYHDLKTTLITEKNTHSFSQYIQDPEVNFLLFRLILGLDLNFDDKAAAVDRYDDGSLQGAYAELEGALSDFSPSELGNIGDIVDAARKLRDFIEA